MGFQEGCGQFAAPQIVQQGGVGLPLLAQQRFCLKHDLLEKNPLIKTKKTALWLANGAHF